jgi:plasmid stabilization system protein ParE
VGNGQGPYPGWLMIQRVIFRPAAELELKEAYAWYEQREVGLGTEFLRSVEVCVHTIRRFPEIFPVVHKSVRQGIIRRFPYSVLYTVAEPQINVISVFHSSRDPKIWKRRA